MLAPTKPVKSCECGSPCGGCGGCTKESIGLGNVDNTSDLNKPLSIDMVNALNVKVNLDVFTQLKNRVLALENSLGAIGGLENRMDDAELNIENLEHNYTYLSGVISSLTVTVDNLSTRVTGVNDALVTVDTRVVALENSMGAIGDLENRMDDAELNIENLEQNYTYLSGVISSLTVTVDNLEAKDSNNVKLSGVNVQTIQGTLKTNDPASGATDKTLVTANWISQTGATRPNNVLHGPGSEDISGIKTVVYGGRIEDLSSHVKNTRGHMDFCPIYTMNEAELHIVLITLIRGGKVGIIKIDTSATSITKTIILGTMDRRLGVFTDASGHRFLCCELLMNECISTMGMMGETHSGFLGQVYAIVNDQSLGSTDLTQVAVTE